ncbi:MAG: hypothetical protein QNJ45_26660, partial [Ardenticatenaceae bacterium]|nr:hypothetical protein [Ardenticatenaceae bacterium]
RRPLTWRPTRPIRTWLTTTHSLVSKVLWTWGTGKILQVFFFWPRSSCGQTAAIKPAKGLG